MSGMGHEQTSRNVRVMSVIPLKAVVDQRGLHVRFVPQAEVPDSRQRLALICCAQRRTPRCVRVMRVLFEE
jgi:hypothetical protein